MAAKTKTRSVYAGNPMMKPVISSDIMGNRNVEIKPVGAWVQPATETNNENDINAIEAAVEEEQRIYQMQREKEERLRRFQHDVKKRVRHLSLLKKQQEAKTVARSFEIERNIIRQSTKSAEQQSNRIDRCLVRNHPDLAITSESASKLQGNPYKADRFSDQTNQVHEFTSEARRKLGGRQMMTEAYLRDSLPGGVWRDSHPTDHGDSRVPLSEVIDINTEDSDVEDQEDEEKLIQDQREEESENKVRRRLKNVHFDSSPPHRETRQERIERKSVPVMSGDEINRPAMSIRHVPEIYMGVVAENDRRRQRCQTAMYRRLFMDQERDQVKENLRRQEHRKRIQKLKHDKEIVRKEEEALAHRLIQARDPFTGETSEETLVRKHMEEVRLRNSIQKFARLRRKQQESERYVEALRYSLREKMAQKRIQLPPLCCCGLTLWDTNPDTCANNCFYYKNHKAYAKALQSLLVSCEVER